jgi:hypothetical protein
MGRRTDPATASAQAVLERVRLPVGRAIGLADDVPLTNDQLATAIERLAAAVSQVPGVSLLSRDL